MDKLFNIPLVFLRTICFFVDNIVYGLIPILYKLLLYLARVDLVSDNVPVQALIQRIYILIGIFMLFRLSFSIMSYIVNPDAFSDQSKGFTNLVRRVMIAVVLLACIPWFFSKAYEIQGKILTSGILPRLVLGEAGSYKSSNNKSLETSIETSARDLQFLIFSPFFSLNYENADLNICDPGKSGNYSTSHLLGTNGMALSDNCLALMEEYFRTDSQLSASGVSLKDFFRTSNSGKDDKRKFKSFGSLVSWTLKDGEFAINYNPIISTLCGGYLVFLLLSFCIDVAARVIRLMFLQILSPIAVISSIDPTSAGDRLKEWAKECLKVWASLFLRLLVVFLIIQLVRVITDTIYSESFKVAGLSNDKGINIVIFVFLVLGVFQAAKSIPDLIEKATGIKMSGELQLNPFKNSAVAGMTALGLAGAGSLAANAMAVPGRIKDIRDNWRKNGGLYGARDSLSNSWNDFKNRSFDPFSYNGDVKAQRDLLRSARKDRNDNYLQYTSGQISRTDYLARDKSLKSQISNVKRNLYNAKIERSEKRSEDWESYKKSASDVKDAATNIVKPFSESASTIVGVPVGGVSGAVRGAVEGRSAQGVKGVIDASNRARNASSDKREDRNVKSDMGYGIGDRLHDAADRFAGIKSGKTYGVGHMDNEIKALRNELTNLQNELRSAADYITSARQLSINDSALNSLADSLKNASSVDDRGKVLGEIEKYLNTPGLQIRQEDLDSITQLRNAFETRDNLQAQSIEIQKRISKLENASNLDSKS